MFSGSLGCDTGFNTQPPEGGCGETIKSNFVLKFQHTAARRRLTETPERAEVVDVSTHSRPKAAEIDGVSVVTGYVFQHTAARRRLGWV